MSGQKLLNEGELASLHSFVKSKYVEYYDQQVELVDHLASEIERIWETDKTVSFETALNQVYTRFGIHGFTNITQQRRKTIRQSENALTWKEFKLFFQIPRIGVSVIMLVFILVLSSQISSLSFVVVNGVFSVLMVSVELYNRYRYKPTIQFKISAWQFSSSGMLRSNVILPPYLYVFIRPGIIDIESPYIIPVVAFLCWILFLSSSIAFKKTMQKQHEMYPEAFA
jgi:hypothetical protein